MQTVKPAEIDVAAIHDIDGVSLGEQQIECVDVVELAVGYMDKARDISAQIQQRVHLHRRLGVRKCAHGKIARQRSMVVESSA